MKKLFFFVYCGVVFNPQFSLHLQEIDALFLQEERIYCKRYDAVEGVADTEQQSDTDERRSPHACSIEYECDTVINDIVLIALWVLASITDIRYISVVVCFVSFLFNDIYGFISWQKMKERQAE